MKLALVLASCLALLGCDKKKDAAPKPTAPVAGTAAPAAGTAAPAAGTAAPAAGTAAPAAGTAATPPAAAAGDDVKIPWAGHTVGTKTTKVEDRMMKASIEPKPGEAVEMTTVEHSEQHREVLAADGGVLTKAKISYAKQTITESMAGKSREKPTPTLGKTYLVWREGGELKVTLEDGSAPSADEVKAVTKGNRGVGKPDAMETFVASRAWKVGEVVTPDAAQLATIGESMSDDSSKLSAMSLTLTEATDATATFAMKMSMGGATDEGGAMKIDMAGVVVVDRKTGIALSLDLNGPFSGTAGKALLKIAGTMSSKVAYTY